MCLASIMLYYAILPSDDSMKPVLVCTNSHKMCSKCSREISLCPVCRELRLQTPIVDRSLCEMLQGFKND